MRKISFIFACLGIVLGLAEATPSHAQNFHSYVSGNGSGTACTVTVPCFDFATALTATTDGGLISCVGSGPGGFFQVTQITKSITIDCEGVGTTAYAFLINAPGKVITLRNLTITSLGDNNSNNAVIGIDFQRGAALFVEHCVIERWAYSPSVGILFAPNGVYAKLHVTDTVIKNNGLPTSGGGIIVQPSGSGSAQVVIERTQVENNTYGIFANGTGTTGSILLHIKDITVANNTVNGISAYTSGAIAAIVVDHSSSLINGGTGILSQGAGGYVFLTDTTVMSNVTGLSATGGGSIYSYGNNRLTGNVSDGSAPSTSGFALK